MLSFSSWVCLFIMSRVGIVFGLGPAAFHIPLVCQEWDCVVGCNMIHRYLDTLSCASDTLTKTQVSVALIFCTPVYSRTYYSMSYSQCDGVNIHTNSIEPVWSHIGTGTYSHLCWSPVEGSHYVMGTADFRLPGIKTR